MSIVIVGAGPAGLAAASVAAESGAHVTIVDDNPAVGGQIWRASKNPWVNRAATARVKIHPGSRVIDLNTERIVIETADSAHSLSFEKLIVATGSRELFLPFPGWTLPGVFGAGGLQALVKSGLPVRGKRIIVAGTGPLLLAVAAHLQSKGATILAVAEQAPWKALMQFAATLPWQKRWEGLKLWNRKYKPNCWVESAAGNGRLERITLRHNNGPVTMDCDYLAIGYGLVPNRELLSLLHLDSDPIDEYQRTKTPTILSAGEVTGIGGVDLALVEGQIAGYTAAGKLSLAAKLFPLRRKWAHFAKRLNDAFALRAELKALARPDTIVCRCEDVTLAQLDGFTGSREAKLQTRCGMGPCQGRVCGPALHFLKGWMPDSVRPPVFPARLSSLLNTEQP